MLEVIIYIAFGVTAVLLGLGTAQLATSLKHTTPPKKRSELGQDVDLPSVTVCIPARNEQHALTDCLQKVIASNYEKLEIIVLDDSSGDDTSALIKSFASEGVRFVKGKALAEGWLGKNHALQGLLNEASGTYVLFMDVDTRISPDAIENIVRYAITHRTPMVSVLPRREDGWRASVVFSPLRYFWELVFSRKTSPASASNAWLIKRHLLEDRFGGFHEVKNAIQPEAKLADKLQATNEYAFLVSTPAFGVSFEKKWRSQLITSVRLLFPQLQKQVVLAGMAIIDLLLILLPFVVLSSLVFVDFMFIHACALILALISVILYGWYTHRVWNKGWLVGALLLPVIVIQEIALIIASVAMYKRKTVTWKGRTVQSDSTIQ